MEGKTVGRGREGTGNKQSKLQQIAWYRREKMAHKQGERKRQIDG